MSEVITQKEFLYLNNLPNILKNKLGLITNKEYSSYPKEIKILKQVGISCGCRIKIVRIDKNDFNLSRSGDSFKTWTYKYGMSCLNGDFTQMFKEYLHKHLKQIEANLTFGSAEYYEIIY